MRPRRRDDKCKFYNTSSVIKYKRWTLGVGLSVPMTLLMLNCRGLGDTWIVRQLKDLQQREEETVAFLCETKLSRLRMDWVKTQCGYRNMFAVDSRGGSGGVEMLWNDDLSLRLLSYSHRHIDMEVEGVKPWRLTGA